MGVGGMVGGGIFSVLGLAIERGGHAAPLAFALSGVTAFLTGRAYGHLGLSFRSDGGSFTYLEHAFSHRNVAGIGGWLLLAGYIGTLALYAFTFGSYGAAMLPAELAHPLVWRVLASIVLLAFMGVNLVGVRTAGSTEDIIVLVKVAILVLFTAVGIFTVSRSHFSPLFNEGEFGVVMAAALTFVAYEGFELIPYAVNEMQQPERNLHRGLAISIGVTLTLYVLVSIVAVGNLQGSEIAQEKDYALAVAARPFLGQAGFALIGLAALLSTASAINATMFGTARLSMVMAQDKALPKVFSMRERSNDIPWVALVVITVVTLAFVNMANLTIISSFASTTFLLIFASINLAAIRLRKRIGIGPAAPVAGLVLSLGSVVALGAYLWQTNTAALGWIGGFFAAVIAAELLFSERRVLFRRLE